jgi:ethanolamine utilization protein EutQ
MRTLICEKDIKDFAQSGKHEIVIDSKTMMTPSAKDTAQALGIAVIYGSEGQAFAAPNAPAQRCRGGDVIDSDIVYRALSVLASEGLLDDVLGKQGEQGAACAQTGMETENSAAGESSYRAVKNPSGLKIVRGNSVRMEYLDTGNPINDVRYQELISTSDSALMNAGFLEINDCSFPWEVGCDEMYYIMQGPLQITVNGASYAAETGDVVNLPVGVTVNFTAKGRVRVFYAIKAA